MPDAEETEEAPFFEGASKDFCSESAVETEGCGTTKVRSEEETAALLSRTGTALDSDAGSDASSLACLLEGAESGSERGVAGCRVEDQDAEAGTVIFDRLGRSNAGAGAREPADCRSLAMGLVPDSIDELKAENAGGCVWLVPDAEVPSE